jgi:hypothetical protein
MGAIAVVPLNLVKKQYCTPNSGVMNAEPAKLPPGNAARTVQSDFTGAGLTWLGKLHPQSKERATALIRSYHHSAALISGILQKV